MGSSSTPSLAYRKRGYPPIGIPGGVGRGTAAAPAVSGPAPRAAETTRGAPGSREP